jgi:MoaA/NifB/PqqE/SkfB family radical SAM enzyme
MSSEIVQSVTYDNYDDFSTFQLHIFHKISFHYFEDLFNDKTDLWVKYVYTLNTWVNICNCSQNASLDSVTSGIGPTLGP